MTLLARLFSAALCSLILAGAAYAGQQEKLENLRKRISAVQREIDSAMGSKSEVADDLRESERAISDINRKLTELAASQRSADLKLHELQARQQKLRTTLSDHQVLLERLLYQQYLGGQQEQLKLLLSSQDLYQVSRDLQYYRYIARSRAAWLVSLRNKLAALGAVTVQVREQREQLAALRTEQSAQRSKLEVQQRARRQTLLRISRQLRQQRREIRHLQRDESRLAQLVRKIADMLAQPESGALFRNDSLPDSRYDGKPFNQLKGRLALPVKGEVANRYDAPRPDSAMRWKGLFLRTSRGQAVKAIAAGRVVFSDWLRGFGNLLIIDHGDNYMSLYGNNEALYKQVGDVLRGGDTIAAAGNSGGNEDFGLYFELRHESKPLDPMKWLAAR